MLGSETRQTEVYKSDIIKLCHTFVLILARYKTGLKTKFNLLEMYLRT